MSIRVVNSGRIGRCESEERLLQIESEINPNNPLAACYQIWDNRRSGGIGPEA
jgi:hypothetical protein